MGALTSLVLASTLVIFHQLVNVKTGCHCVQKTGGLGNGTSSELQLSYKKWVVSHSMLMSNLQIDQLFHLFEAVSTVLPMAEPALVAAEQCWEPALLPVGWPCQGVTSEQEGHIFKKLALIYRGAFLLLCPGLFRLPGRRRAVEIPELQVAKNCCWGAILSGLLHMVWVDLIGARFPGQDAKALNFPVSIYHAVGMMGHFHILNGKGRKFAYGR